MNKLWQSLCERIVAPAQLDHGQLSGLLTPAGTSPHLRRHAATVILARVQLIAALFAVLVPLCSVIDLLVFDTDVALRLTGLRLLSAALFVSLAWPRQQSAPHPYTQAIGTLLILLLIPSLFHLFSVDMLAHANQTREQRLVVQLYAYLPTVVLGGLAIFPLTALETLLLALPVIGTGLGALALGNQTISLEQQGGTLWFMVMMLGVAMFSGMSQCQYMSALVMKALYDPLTGAYTRQSGSEALDLNFRLSAMTGRPLSLLFIDLDHFKAINDNHGHEAGDQALRTMADGIRRTLRRNDILIRWGGEEFVAVLPETPLDNVSTLLHRLRLAFGQRPEGTPLTASIGVAESHTDAAANWAALVALADQRMYAAKHRGRDCAVLPDGSQQSLGDTPA